MTKQMRKEGVQFFNRKTKDMFKVEHGIVYKRTKRNSWLMMLGTTENMLLDNPDVIYLDGNRVLALSLAVPVCVALGLALWGGLV